MNDDYDKIKAFVIEAMVNSQNNLLETIRIDGSYACSSIRRYLRTLAGSKKSSVKIKFLPKSVKIPTLEGEAGCGGMYHYTRSTLRLEVGEHWFLNHFNIRQYKQYEDFDGWAKHDYHNYQNNKFIRFTFKEPKPIKRNPWIKVKLMAV